MTSVILAVLLAPTFIEGKPSMGKATENLARVTRIGLDLAKTDFQVHGVGAQGEVITGRKLRRWRMLEFFGRLAPCVVATEACGSAHHWDRQLVALGHEVKLIPPAHVKPYVRRNKTDAADTAAICEAAMRPGQRFVALRSVDNQAAVMRHRVREQLVGSAHGVARASGRDRARGGPGRPVRLPTEANAGGRRGRKR
jgi:transposase